VEAAALTCIKARFGATRMPALRRVLRSAGSSNRRRHPVPAASVSSDKAETARGASFFPGHPEERNRIVAAANPGRGAAAIVAIIRIPVRR